MAQAQLNFHVSAEKIKAQEQKKLLFEVFFYFFSLVKASNPISF